MNFEEYEELMDEKIHHTVKSVLAEAEDFVKLHSGTVEPMQKLIMLSAFIDMVSIDILKSKTKVMAGVMLKLGAEK